jgi:hypothetical protein
MAPDTGGEQPRRRTTVLIGAGKVGILAPRPASDRLSMGATRRMDATLRLAQPGPALCQSPRRGDALGRVDRTMEATGAVLTTEWVAGMVGIVGRCRRPCAKRMASLSRTGNASTTHSPASPMMAVRRSSSAARSAHSTDALVRSSAGTGASSGEHDIAQLGRDRADRRACPRRGRPSVTHRTGRRQPARGEVCDRDGGHGPSGRPGGRASGRRWTRPPIWPRSCPFVEVQQTR